MDSGLKNLTRELAAHHLAAEAVEVVAARAPVAGVGPEQRGGVHVAQAAARGHRADVG